MLCLDWTVPLCCSLDAERLTSSTGRGVGSLSVHRDNAPPSGKGRNFESSWSRPEDATHGASYGSPRLLVAALGVSTRHETGLAVDCLRLSSQDLLCLLWGECPNTYQQPPMLTIPRIWDANKQGKDVGGKGVFLTVMVFFLFGNKQACVCAPTHSFF